jgi:hypothetical protein
VLVLALPVLAARPSLVWRDAVTGKVWLSVEDIVRFDWERQRFEVTRERAMDMMAADIGLSRRFSVEDGQGAIYKGTAVSLLSSMSYEGPVIVLGPGSTLYEVSAGYHLRPGGTDERFAPRLRAALERAHVLGRIDDPSQVKPIEVLAGPGPWLLLAPGLRATEAVFPETFTSGANGRVHVTFLADEGFEPRFDRVSVEMHLTSQEGAPLVTREILSLQASALPKPGFPNRRTHVCKRPLEGLPGNWHGAATITFRYTLTGRALKSPEVRYSAPISLGLVGAPTHLPKG